MFPRNAASPERIAIGPVVLIADGTVQTSGVSVKVMPQGGAASAGGGTIAYEEGIVHYLPTQAETNYTSFMLIAYKTGCIPVATTVVTTASATAGKVVLSGETHTSAVIPTVTTLTGHTAQTGDSFARIGANGAGLTDLATAANLATVAGYLDTEIAAILADTNELQTDWANGGRLDLILDARASQTSVDDLPTNAELATSQASADDATLAAIAALSIPTAAAIADAVWDEAIAGHAGAGSTGEALAGATAPSAATVADAVWDEVLSGHLTASTTGNALNAAGDPWTTALPGAYGAGTAGKIIGDNITGNAYTRLGAPAGASVSDDIAAVKAETASILTDTAEIGAAGIGLTVLATQASVNTIDDFLDTEVGAIKTKTDYLPSATAGAAGGLFIAGSNAATTVATLTCTGAFTVDGVATVSQTGDSYPFGSRTVCRGTVSATAPTTTGFTASAMSPAGAVADQFKGRILIFDLTTTTTALRGQATDITANTNAALPVFTFTALTTAPASGDTFSIV